MLGAVERPDVRPPQRRHVALHQAHHMPRDISREHRTHRLLVTPSVETILSDMEVANQPRIRMLLSHHPQYSPHHSSSNDDKRSGSTPRSVPIITEDDTGVTD